MPSPDQSRRYGDLDAERILRRAVELDDGAADARLDLVQLREIAAEVGVGPVSVDRAALELTAPGTSALARLAGGPGFFRVERDLPGPVSPVEASHVADVVRRILGRHGRLQPVVDGLEWREVDPYGSVVVAVGPTPDGGMRLRVSADRRGAAQFTWILSGAGALVLGLAVVNQVPGLGAAEILAAWTGSVAAGAGVAHGIWSRISAVWRARVAAVADELGRAGLTKETPERPSGEDLPPSR
jgi:hypothetical protein